MDTQHHEPGWQAHSRAQPPDPDPVSGQLVPTSPQGSQQGHEQGKGGDEQQHAARMFATDRLRDLVENLRPYTDGTLGEVSPRHAAVQVTAIRELNRLWSAYYVPVQDHDSIEDDEQNRAAEQKQALEAAAATRTRVLAALDQLRDRESNPGEGGDCERAAQP